MRILAISHGISRIFIDFSRDVSPWPKVEISMAVFNLPRSFKNINTASVVELDGCSSVLYNQSIDQERVAVCSTQSMFAVILGGKKIIHTEKGDIEIASGDMFFARRGAYLLSERMNVDGCYRSLIFFIDDSFLHRFASRNSGLLKKYTGDSADAPGIYKVSSYPLFASWIDSVLPVFLSTYANRRELLEVKLEELLQHLINSDECGPFVAFLDSFLHQEKCDLERFMAENFSMPLNNEEFAGQSGRSLTVFKQDFKTAFGTPPGAWINSKRLERARTILANTGSSVTEVCYDVGFGSVSHFILLFKKKYGITPKKFQQNSKGSKRLTVNAPE